jgi:hypothetical protein
MQLSGYGPHLLTTRVQIDQLRCRASIQISTQSIAHSSRKASLFLLPANFPQEEVDRGTRARERPPHLPPDWIQIDQFRGRPRVHSHIKWTARSLQKAAFFLYVYQENGKLLQKDCHTCHPFGFRSTSFVAAPVSISVHDTRPSEAAV